MWLEFFYFTVWQIIRFFPDECSQIFIWNDPLLMKQVSAFTVAARSTGVKYRSPFICVLTPGARNYEPLYDRKN
jgi:hypothetical protein